MTATRFAGRCAHVVDFFDGVGSGNLSSLRAILLQCWSSKPVDGTSVVLEQCSGRSFICLRCATAVSSFAEAQQHRCSSTDGTTGPSLLLDARRSELYCGWCRDFVYDAEFDQLITGVRASTAPPEQQPERDTAAASESLGPITAHCADEAAPLTALDYGYGAANGNDRGECLPVVVAEGRHMPPRGLHNLGNTCFINCVLQALLSAPLLRNYYLAGGHPQETCSRGEGSCMSCELDALFGEAYCGEGHAYCPASFLYSWWHVVQNHLAGYQQQDAHEFHLFLVGQLGCSQATSLAVVPRDDAASVSDSDAPLERSGATTRGPAGSCTVGSVAGAAAGGGGPDPDTTTVGTAPGGGRRGGGGNGGGGIADEDDDDDDYRSAADSSFVRRPPPGSNGGVGGGASGGGQQQQQQARGGGSSGVGVKREVSPSEEEGASESPTAPRRKGGAAASDESILDRVLGGLLRSDVTCCTCGHTSTTHDPFIDISLDIDPPPPPPPPLLRPPPGQGKSGGAAGGNRRSSGGNPAGAPAQAKTAPPAPAPAAQPALLRAAAKAPGPGLTTTSAATVAHNSNNIPNSADNPLRDSSGRFVPKAKRLAIQQAAAAAAASARRPWGAAASAAANGIGGAAGLRVKGPRQAVGDGGYEGGGCGGGAAASVSADIDNGSSFDGASGGNGAEPELSTGGWQDDDGDDPLVTTRCMLPPAWMGPEWDDDLSHRADSAAAAMGALSAPGFDLAPGNVDGANDWLDEALDGPVPGSPGGGAASGLGASNSKKRKAAPTQNMNRCGVCHTCKNKHLKKACLRNKALRLSGHALFEAVLAAVKGGVPPQLLPTLPSEYQKGLDPKVVSLMGSQALEPMPQPSPTAGGCAPATAPAAPGGPTSSGVSPPHQQQQAPAASISMSNSHFMQQQQAGLGVMLSGPLQGGGAYARQFNSHTAMQQQQQQHGAMVGSPSGMVPPMIGSPRHMSATGGLPMSPQRSSFQHPGAGWSQQQQHPSLQPANSIGSMGSKGSMVHPGAGLGGRSQSFTGGGVAGGGAMMHIGSTPPIGSPGADVAAGGEAGSFTFERMASLPASPRGLPPAQGSGPLPGSGLDFPQQQQQQQQMMMFGQMRPPPGGGSGGGGGGMAPPGAAGGVGGGMALTPQQAQQQQMMLMMRARQQAAMQQQQQQATTGAGPGTRPPSDVRPAASQQSRPAPHISPEAMAVAAQFLSAVARMQAAGVNGVPNVQLLPGHQAVLLKPDASKPEGFAILIPKPGAPLTQLPGRIAVLVKLEPAAVAASGGRMFGLLQLMRTPQGRPQLAVMYLPTSRGRASAQAQAQQGAAARAAGSSPAMHLQQGGGAGQPIAGAAAGPPPQQQPSAAAAALARSSSGPFNGEPPPTLQQQGEGGQQQQQGSAAAAAATPGAGGEYQRTAAVQAAMRNIRAQIGSAATAAAAVSARPITLAQQQQQGGATVAPKKAPSGPAAKGGRAAAGRKPGGRAPAAAAKKQQALRQRKENGAPAPLPTRVRVKAEQPPAADDSAGSQPRAPSPSSCTVGGTAPTATVAAAAALGSASAMRPVPPRTPTPPPPAVLRGGLARMSLLGCLHRFVRPESLGVTDKWVCSSCNTLQRAVKQMSIRRLPPVLCLHLKRFEHRGVSGVGRKLDTPISFPVTGLDLGPYLSSSVLRQRYALRRTAVADGGGDCHDSHENRGRRQRKRAGGEDSGCSERDGDGEEGGVLVGKTAVQPRAEALYDLYCAVVHRGNLQGGHYVSYVRCGESWFLCDDAWVAQVDEAQVQECNPYMLYYVRSSLRG